MEILSSHAQVEAYLDEAWMTSDRPLLVDEYLGHAIEVDVDATCDGSEVHIGAVMEHLEEAGIHSGDSTCFIPPQTLTDDVVREIEELTERIGLELGICGCYNIQFAIQGEIVRVLEVNPRSSRTVPFVAKSTGVPVARIAARAPLGIPFSEQDLPEVRQDRVCVKAPVFPFIKLRGLDPAPGPEMKSTGEVFGSAPTADVAYLKARMATEIPIPVQGGVYLTVRDQDKQALIPIAQDLIDLGFNIHATRGTSDVLRNAGLEVNTVYRIKEPGSPDALDLMRTSLVQFIVNVPSNSGGAVLDGNMMRRLAVELNIPFVTTLSGARMEVAAIRAARAGLPEPMCL